MSVLKVDKIQNKDGQISYYEKNSFKNIKIDKTCRIDKSHKDRFIVQHKFTSSDYENFYIASGDELRPVPGMFINMGVPSKSVNWYRIQLESICDDSGGSASGIGFFVYRRVGSGQLELCVGQGQHAHYKNNMSDYYVNAKLLAYVPAVNNVDEHSFQIYVRANNTTSWILNCEIGDDFRRNGWNNNILQITEYDGDLVDNGLLTRY